MASRSTELKVGIFVCLALAGLAYMTTQVTRGKVPTDEMTDIYTYFDNVSGLKINAPVEIAGIEVGLVKGISLEDGKARVLMALRPDVRVYTDARAGIRTRGVLGDKYLEISPGSSTYPAVGEGGRIARSETPEDLEQVLTKVGRIADDIGRISKSVASVMGGENGENNLRAIVNNLRDMSKGLNIMVQANMVSVNQIVSNMQSFSSDLSQISAANKDGISKIVTNLEVASLEVQTTLNHMNTLLGGLHEGNGPMARLISDEEMGDDMKETVASLESVSRKIDEGKGTIGKLVNDDKTGKELDKALEGINKYLEQQDRFVTTVDFTPEYMAKTGDIKSYLNLKIQPTSDKYYLLSVISDPQGYSEKTTTEKRYQTDGGQWHTYYEEKDKTYKRKLKFSAQIAKRWHDLVLRGGIIESTGGAGVDYYLWDDRLKLFMEAFDFQHDENPHLKAGGKLYFLRNFYLSAGVDDFVSDHGNTSFFTGLGFHFSDDDLKYIFSGASSSVPTN